MDLDKAARSIEELKQTILFASDQLPESCLFATRHYFAALASLEQAAQQMRLAELFQARETAGNF